MLSIVEDEMRGKKVADGWEVICDKCQGSGHIQPIWLEGNQYELCPDCRKWLADLMASRPLRELGFVPQWTTTTTSPDSVTVSYS